MQSNNLGKIDAIYAILNALGHTENEQRSLRETFTKSETLEYLHTVGMHIPRQTGATRWIEHCLFSNPKAIVFTRPRFVDNLKRRSTCDQRVFGFKLDNLPTAEELPESVNQIFVDEANFIFRNNFERKSFYQWLSKLDCLSEDVKVVFMYT